MYNCKILSFLLLLHLIWVVPQRSTATSLIEALRNLAQEGDKYKPKPIQQTSPSPSPHPAVAKSNSGDAKVDANPAKTRIVDEETCDPDLNKCHDDVKNVTACVLATAGDTSHGLFLLVHNDGDSSLNLSATIFPINSTYNVTDIPGHQVRKINVSSNVSGSSSIVLNAANWTCIIERGVRVPQLFPSYIAYVKPINGVYLLVATALLIGVMWACCKLGKDGRHLNGVPYQELEMGQQESGSSINNETVEGWDQSWDDDWDEEKPVESPGGNHIGNRRANGISSRSADTNGWGSDWDD